MTISEKVAYLKGLAEGMELDTEKKEGKILAAIIDVLDDIADEIEDIEENALDIGDELDAISDDLAEVEEIVYGEEDDECDCCHDEDDCMFTITCPSCEEEIVVDEDVLDLGEIVCPNCGETLEFEFDEDDEEEAEEEK